MGKQMPEEKNKQSSLESKDFLLIFLLIAISVSMFALGILTLGAAAAMENVAESQELNAVTQFLFNLDLEIDCSMLRKAAAFIIYLALFTFICALFILLNKKTEQAKIAFIFALASIPLLIAIIMGVAV